MQVGYRLEHLEQQRPFFDRGQRVDRPLQNRLAGIGHEVGLVGSDLHPQPFTRRTPAQRRIEREVMRGQLLKAAAALFTGKMQAEPVFPPLRLGLILLDMGDPQDSQPQFQCRFDRIGQASPLLGIERHAVHDDVHDMLPPPVHFRNVFQPMGFAVDADSGKTLLLQLQPQLIIRRPDWDLLRCEQQQLRPGRPSHDLVDDFIRRLRLDGDVTGRAIRLSQPREQDPQVVVDLCHGADGRAWRVPDGLLFNRNGRRQSTNMLQLRLGHLTEELAGIGRQRFDIPPLPLGIQRVHGE